MRKWLDKRQAAVFFAFCILFIFQPYSANSENTIRYEISNIGAALAQETLTYTISGSSAPVYTVTERFTPFRVVLDIAGGVISDVLDQKSTELPENQFTTLKLSDLNDQTPQKLRFEFNLAESHNYSVDVKDNTIIAKFYPATNKNENENVSELPGVRVLKDFKISSTPNSTTISILSNGTISNYTVDTIGSGVKRPPRMFIDIDDVDINELSREKQIGTSVQRVRVAPRGTGARIVFDSASKELFKYSVLPTPSGLDVVIDESMPTQEASSGGPVAAAPQPGGTDTTLDELIDSSEQLLEQDPDKIVADAVAAKAAALKDDFSFSGYKKQRISVDFYKIDIHNVFRLFRQITNLNIIVDEEVQGLLTLALTDVPWDFALDIILNLMDLRKEERFNTIVIYPSEKQFAWPTRAEDNLEFEADIEIIEQESLVIEKTASQSKEIMQAKDLMIKAQNLETREEFEDAALLYSKALELWPDNNKISNRLATLYLVNLGMNAKAVYFAKHTLKHSPQSPEAALYAAIGSANMQRFDEAKEYFGQAISENPPMKEALMSYAAFSENNGHNDAALTLIDKYESHYGENINTMIAKARIFDKQGLTAEATKQYKAVLASGFQLRQDLKKYIHGRVSTKGIN